MSQRSRFPRLRAMCAQIRKDYSSFATRPGVHTVTYLQAAGFRYIAEENSARCDECGLQVSHWAEDVNPFTIHAQQKPTCPFLLSLQSPIPLPPAMFRDGSESQAVQANDPQSPADKLIESRSLRNVRKATFSHWPHRDTLSSENMTAAGFFSSTVDDRATCLYCNLFCHHWTPHVDDPCEVHKTLSPRCPYVKNYLVSHQRILTINTDGNSIRPTAPSNTQSIHANDSARRLQQDNSNGPSGAHSTSSSLDNAIQADYLDANTKKKAICPVCGGSFNFLASNEPVIIEHARQYPLCTYARQFFGVGPFRAIQDLHQAILLLSHSNSLRNDRQGNNDLSKRIAAALDLPMSREVLRRKIHPDVLQECWRRQWTVKNEDFESVDELYMACFIVQKERRHIGDHPERIFTPCRKMWELRLNRRNEYHSMLAAAGQSNHQPQHNPCAVCLTEERHLACVPCGHVATCVPCGHSLRSCPMCREEIQAFVRVYV